MAAAQQNCIFCKIISGEIPSVEIFSDDTVKVILDINPAQEGHALILPKEHYQILPQIPDAVIGKLFVQAKKTSRVLLKGLGVQGTTIFVANGALAGQKAPHFMIHVIPRKKGDMLFDMPKTVIPDEQLDQVHKGLASRMAALTGRKLAGPAPASEKPKPHVEEANVRDKSEKAQKKPAPQPSQKEDTSQEDTTTKDDETDVSTKETKSSDMSIDDITRMFK